MTDQYGQTIVSRLEAALEVLEEASHHASRLQFTWGQTHPEPLPSDLMDVFGAILRAERICKEVLEKHKGAAHD